LELKSENDKEESVEDEACESAMLKVREKKTWKSVASENSRDKQVIDTTPGTENGNYCGWPLTTAKNSRGSSDKKESEFRAWE